MANSIQPITLLTKKMVLPTKCFAYPGHNATKTYVIFLPVLLKILQFRGWFSVSSKHVKSFNENFDLTETEGDSFLKHIPIRWSSLLPEIFFDVKKLTWWAMIVSKCWTVRMSFSNSIFSLKCKWYITLS